MSRRWKGPVPERITTWYEPGSDKHEEQKERQREWYRKNREAARASANNQISKKRLRNQQWLVNYLNGKGCQDCGITDPCKLTFDHIDPTSKHANVADLTSRGSKLEHLEAEVAKCEVVCHNCHMLRTYKSIGGTFRDRLKPITNEEFEELRRELGV